MMTHQHDDSLLDVIGLLVLLQGGIAVVSTLEAGILGAVVGGGALVLTVINLVGAGVALIASWGIRRRSRVARKTVIWIQIGVLVVAGLELLLAIFLAKRGLELVPVLTRVALPIAVIRLLRRPYVRGWFGIQTAEAVT